MNKEQKPKISEDKADVKESAFTKVPADKEKKETIPEDLNKKIEECQKLKDEYLAGWQRARADLINYKKEESERTQEVFKYAGVGIALKMLPILDNFELIESKLPEDLKKDENVKGILKTKNQLLGLLKNMGMEEIKSIGEKFDPNLHEAVETVEIKGNGSAGSPQEKSGIIIEEVQRGYRINNGVLRPSKVKIAK